MQNSIGLYCGGGLGNQLFQIFTLISKAIDTNRDFYILFDIKDKRTFNINLFKSIADKINIGDYNLPYDTLNVYNDKSLAEYSPIPDHCQMIRGVFANPLYFNHNRDKIIEILKLNELQFKYKFNFKKIIAIHFRFEDYISLYCVQTPNFYVNALNILKEEIKEDFYNYKFIIFSSKGEKDNILTDIYIENINKILEKPINFIKFQDLYPNANTEEEFIYMSNSNYFINPGSTFSWFAYYICPYNDKKTIISNTLMNMNYMQLYDLDGIIKINSDIFHGNIIQYLNI